MERLWAWTVVAGGAVLTVGVGLFSVPAAVCVAGVLLILAGLSELRSVE